jgi:hypothetical protein
MKINFKMLYRQHLPSDGLSNVFPLEGVTINKI